MLQLLSVHQAALLYLYWNKKIEDPFCPDMTIKVLNDSELKHPFSLTCWFLNNAIESGELPALIKPKNKAYEKKVYEQLRIPEEVREFLSKQHDCWIAYSDLLVFLQRPDQVSDTDYAHSREALARVAWVLAKQHAAPTDQASFFDYLAQRVEDMTGDGFILGLAETTIKGCVREIFAAGQAVEKKTSDSS